MAKAKPAAPADTSVTIEALATLRQAIDRLTNHVQILTEAIDQLTDEIGWRNNQLGDDVLSSPSHAADKPPPMHLTSLPADPTSKNWQLNRVTPIDLSPTAEPKQAP